MEGVLQAQPPDPAAGAATGAAAGATAGGGDGDSVSWNQMAPNRNRGGRSGGCDSKTQGQDASDSNHASPPLPSLPEALASPPCPLPPPVGRSPAGSRFWLLAGECSEEVEVREPSVFSSGMFPNPKYLVSTASIEVDDASNGSILGGFRLDNRNRVRNGPKSQKNEGWGTISSGVTS